MLIGAKQIGMEILGGIEWRKYYHTETFPKNFNAPLFNDRNNMTGGDREGFKNATIAYGHPDCGNFSNLRVKKTAKLTDAADIPLFVEMVKEFRPKFFSMDNLPKAIIAYPVRRWVEELGRDYDLFPEWVSNYHYGNTQINRRRFFMIGARKEFEYVFTPGEFQHDLRLDDVIYDLPKWADLPEINHVHWKDSDIMYGWGSHNFDNTKDKGTKHITLGELKEAIRDYPPKKNFAYYNRFGESKLRPGYSKIVLDNYSPVMSGGGSAPDNHYRADTLNPLTARERARIQGCPDSFIFYPLNYIEDKKTYMMVYKQIGKFMPIEFNKFFAEQVKAHLEGYPFECSGKRYIKFNEYIDAGKLEACDSTHCQQCWIDQKCDLQTEGGS